MLLAKVRRDEVLQLCAHLSSASAYLVEWYIPHGSGTRALLFGVYIKAPDFLKLPCGPYEGVVAAYPGRQLKGPLIIGSPDSEVQMPLNSKVPSLGP